MLSRLTLLTLLAGLCLGQDAARKEITLDPQTLSRYVGAYQMGNGPVMLVTLENNQLFTKLGNQQAIPIYPESKTMFFPKVVDAEIEFGKDDDKGRPTELILHQNGREMAADRLDDATAKLWPMPRLRSPSGSRTRRPRLEARRPSTRWLRISHPVNRHPMP